MKAPVLNNEPARLRALRELDILDSAPEQSFDELAALAAEVCGTPFALITLVAEDRQWIKARAGLELAETPRDDSFCAHAIAGRELLVVRDAATDPRFAQGPLVRGHPHLRFYAGAPLVTSTGEALGTLCVLDRMPRELTERQRRALQIFSRQVMTELELRRAVREEARMRQALAASEERFRLLARATNDAVWDWDVVGERLYWDEGYETLFGHRREEVPPGIASWTDYIHPDDLPRVQAGIQRALENGMEWQDDYRFRHRDGRYLHVQNRGQVIRDSAGRATRMVGGMTDLTERRRAEAKLREQAALIDNAHDAIAVRDCEQRITYWNRAAEKIYGWTAAEAMGRKMEELLKVDAGRFAEASRAVFAAGAWNGELQKTAKDGTLLTVEASWSLQCDVQGRPQAILTIDTDITERRNLEQQFLRAQRMESIGTLAGGIAHDLNNLLAPIAMGIELLRRNEPSPKSQLIIENIERSAKRGAALVKQVLSFARGVEGSRVPLELKHILGEVQAIVENTFPKNIVFDCHVPPDLWMIVGDPTQLNQVLLNLSVNARDALPGGGHLRIATSNVEVDEQYAVMNRGVAAGRYVVVEVIDDGIGIPREIIDRIFEPFFTTKQIGQGTGLGLSTVLGIVRSHGGFVNVYSEPGRGSTFKVYLPALSDAVVSAPSVDGEARLPRGDGELVLVVDDEPPILNVTRQSLEAFGYRVLTADDGAQAIGLFATHQHEIAVVLTDMMMPVMDGPALIAALRRINPRVRIIAASGLSANADVARASRSGVRHFLPKPYSADILLMLLRKVLTERDSRSPV